MLNPFELKHLPRGWTQRGVPLQQRLAKLFRMRGVMLPHLVRKFHVSVRIFEKLYRFCFVLRAVGQLPPTQYDVRDYPDAPNVTEGGVRIMCQHLRRGVVRCAYLRFQYPSHVVFLAFRRLVVIRSFDPTREPKIDYFDVGVVTRIEEQKVARLQITMYDSSAVTVRDGLGDIFHQRGRFALADSPFSGSDAIVEFSPIGQLGDDVDMCCGFVNLVKFYQVGVGLNLPQRGNLTS